MDIGDRGAATSERAPWRLLAVAALFLAAIAAWVVTEPDTVPTADHVAVHIVMSPGESRYVGYLPFNDRDITVERAVPVTVGPVSADASVCTRRPDAPPIGSGDAGDLEAACERIDPLGPGTVLPAVPAGEVPETYVVVELTTHAEATGAFCGLDVDYRDARRRGTNRQGGSHQVLVTEHPVGTDQQVDDWTTQAGCPVAANG